MKTDDGGRPLFSLSERAREAAMPQEARSEAAARLKRVIARSNLEGQVQAAQEKLRMAEDRQRFGSPRANKSTFARRIFMKLGLVAKEPARPEETGSTERTLAVETARLQLERLLKEDGPTILELAEEVAQAIRPESERSLADADAPPERRLRGPRRVKQGA